MSPDDRGRKLAESLRRAALDLDQLADDAHADEDEESARTLLNAASAVRAARRAVARVAAPSETEAGDGDECSACGGTGETYDPGHYVPGEQFVEPPTGPDMCGPCRGTGHLAATPPAQCRGRVYDHPADPPQQCGYPAGHDGECLA